MSVRILIGDVREQLATLADESVHCVVTSPPYWGLRDYGVDGQIGLEASPAEYVDAMVQVFRGVRRVLRADGTCWVNLGDSYANDTKWGGSTGGKHVSALHDTNVGRGKCETGLKAKDLVGIPWRVAFALQADGWYLRQDIIWSKPNPMPESVRDRCTKAHEYIFLLSKSERYYYDIDATKEPVALSSVERLSQPGLADQAGSNRVPGKTNGPMKAVGHIPGNKSHKGTTAYENGDERMRTKAGLVDDAERQRSKRDSFKRDTKESDVPGQTARQHREDREESMWNTATRNKRSVWTVTTQPFKEAHFATFPPALIEPCILAGCPADGTVLDPFFGAGTTGLVADRHGRNCIGIELNPKYAAMAQRRITGDSPLFAEVGA